MGLKERLLLFIEYKGISTQKFERIVGLSNASVSKMGDNTRQSTLDKISISFPDLDIAWLKTGIGNMINENKNTAGRDNYGSQGSGDNKSSYSNVGNTKISVTMPESGTQKIIKPTGEVEIHRLDPSDKSNSEELDRLKQRIQDLERIIAEKDVTIQSKEATIQSKDDTIKSKDELISFLKGDRQ